MPEPDDGSCKSLATLKAWVVGELKVLEEKFKAIEAADKLLREQNKIHFEALNNEGKRITAMTEKTVSQDTWNGFMKQYEERQSQLQRMVDGSVSKEEFQSYKATTERALTLKAGQSQGVGTIGAIVLGLFVAMSALTTVFTFIITLFKH